MSDDHPLTKHCGLTLDILIAKKCIGLENETTCWRLWSTKACALRCSTGAGSQHGQHITFSAYRADANKRAGLSARVDNQSPTEGTAGSIDRSFATTQNASPADTVYRARMASSRLIRFAGMAARARRSDPQTTRPRADQTFIVPIPNDTRAETRSAHLGVRHSKSRCGIRIDTCSARAQLTKNPLSHKERAGFRGNF